MGNAGQDPTYRHVEQKIIEPLLAFRQKVQPLNQTHNDCIQQFTKIIMGLLTGSDGETAFQGPGSDALAELIGKFFDGEQQLAGTDPLTLEGRLLDAAVICEQHAHNLQATVKSFSASRSNGNPSMFATIGALLDGGDNPGDEGPDDPDDIAIGELYEYQADMQAPINEPLPATPDINALPANVPPNPSLGDNAGFIQSLGIDEPDVNTEGITSTSQLDPNLPAQLDDGGTIDAGGRSGGARPLYGPPNSYMTTSGGHVLIYDGQGRLIFDIDANRVKMTVWDQAPNGNYYPRDVKLTGPVPPEYLALLP